MVTIAAAVDASAASTQFSSLANLFDSERKTLTCAAGDALNADAKAHSSSTARGASVLLLGCITAFASARMHRSASSRAASVSLTELFHPLGLTSVPSLSARKDRDKLSPHAVDVSGKDAAWRA